MPIPPSNLPPRTGLLHLLLVPILLLAASGLTAQQAASFGPYNVHYNALNTSVLTPEIAQAYGIQRAGSRALLNVTVIEADSLEPVPARITAEATNLTGQRREIELREIRDQGAIYYIGTFRIHNEETLNFAIEVNPEGHQGEPYSFDFRQQFFVD